MGAAKREHRSGRATSGRSRDASANCFVAPVSGQPRERRDLSASSAPPWRTQQRDAQLRFLALEGRAQTLEAMGNTDQALQAWDRLASDAPAYADRALYGKGRLLEEQGRTDEARQAYETIRSEHGQGAMARLAAE